MKNFADELDKFKLQELFSKFGQITSAVVMYNDDGKSKGFGFVAFKRPEDAMKVRSFVWNVEKSYSLLF